MPYISSIERLARQEERIDTLRDLIARVLAKKFGAAGKRLLPKIQRWHDEDRLWVLIDTLATAKTLEEVRTAIG